MPYKSKAQERYFHAAEERGDIKPSVVKEFDEASKGISLPQKLKKDKEHEKRKKLWRGGKE